VEEKKNPLDVEEGGKLEDKKETTGGDKNKYK